jgi:hypothetical protein
MSSEEEKVPQPIAINFDRTEKEKNTCDGLRRKLKSLFVNLICTSPCLRARENKELTYVFLDVALKARGEDPSSINKMSWKWADMAVTHRLHIQGWPLALKEMFPSSSFDLMHINGKDGNAAMKDMVDDLEKRYKELSYDSNSGVMIMSWTAGMSFPFHSKSEMS